MSRYEDSKRRLAEALAQAMDADLAMIPPKAQIEREHQFSRKFKKNMQRIIRRYGKKAPASNNSGITRGAWQVRYGGMVAAMLCVVSLTAVAGMMSQMHMGSAEQATGIEEGASEYECAEDFDGAETEESSAEADIKEAVTEEAATEEPTDSQQIPQPEEGDKVNAGEQEICAPDWQEQLLAESAQAEKLVYWRLGAVYEEGTIELESGLEADLQEQTQTSLTPKKVRVSSVYEVYYEQHLGDWIRVYHASEREVSECPSGMLWGDTYRMEDLGMTQAGNYRLVRQVNHWRQVLQLTLNER